MRSGWLCFLSFSLGPPVPVRQKRGGWTLLMISFISLHLIKALLLGGSQNTACLSCGGNRRIPTQPYWHSAGCPLLLAEERWKVSSLLSLSDNTQSTDGSFLLVSKESKKVVWKISFLFTPAKLARAEDYVVSTSVGLE